MKNHWSHLPSHQLQERHTIMFFSSLESFLVGAGEGEAAAEEEDEEQEWQDFDPPLLT
jgi:hypothetical protein